MGPFMSLCLLNAIFDIFRFFSVWTFFSLVPFYIVVLSLSIAVQLYCFVECLRVYKDLVGSFEPGRDPEMGTGRYVRLTDGNRFPGEGRRLG